MNRIGYITAILLAVLLCGSCINEEYAGPDPDLPTRTIIVYLGGDNNLSEETGRKIEALRQGWTYTGNKCLIYQDSRDGARLLRLRGGCGRRRRPMWRPCGEYGAENSASAETFAGCCERLPRRISGRQLRIDLLLARQWLVAGWRFAEPGAPIPFGRGGRRGRGTRRNGYCRVCGSDTRRDVRFHCF